MFGFGSSAAHRQSELERSLLARASTDRVARLSRMLAGRPHIAGTPGQAWTRDYVLEQMAAGGLATDVAEYEVYLPHPVRAVLERVVPHPHRFNLIEPPLAEVPGSADPAQWPAWHAYAAAGDVTGPLVYVNYAREADLAQLRDRGVRLDGCIALARYGELFRGNKVLNVQRYGAIGCILYSDPYDDGYFRGDVYPVGSMRPPGGVQRGSLNTGAGDPERPGRAAAGGPRTSRDQITVLPQIPSIPIGYGAAEELLRGLAGAEVPDGWQGALPFAYHLGPGPVQMRLVIQHDGGRRKIWNTFGRIVGTEHPEQLVIVGGHRDAWCCGAVDNVSGVVSVTEAALLCAELARAGSRPRRTLLFATWDAEEWGLIGSTEWCAEHAGMLAAHARAYLNQDVAVVGPTFGASGSPALTRLLQEVAACVPDPGDARRRVLDNWSASEGGAELKLPGGGSDHEPFFVQLGVPYAAWGFGRAKWGNYHSAYDASEWMERIGDPGYERHRATASMTALTALRLANADVLPLDYVPYAAALTAALTEFRARAEREPPIARDSLARVLLASERFAGSAHAAVAHCATQELDRVRPAERAALDAALAAVERALLRPEPCPEGRNLAFGADPTTGYSGLVLPGLVTALRGDDVSALAPECDKLSRALELAATRLIATCGKPTS